MSSPVTPQEALHVLLVHAAAVAMDEITDDSGSDLKWELAEQAVKAVEPLIRADERQVIINRLTKIYRTPEDDPWIGKSAYREGCAKGVFVAKEEIERLTS